MVHCWPFHHTDAHHLRLGRAAGSLLLCAILAAVFFSSCSTTKYVPEGKYLLPNGEMDDERYIADLNSAERLIELRSDTVDDEKLVTQIENLVTGENDIEPIPTNRLFPLLSQFYRD